MIAIWHNSVLRNVRKSWKKWVQISWTWMKSLRNLTIFIKGGTMLAGLVWELIQQNQLLIIIYTCSTWKIYLLLADQPSRILLDITQRQQLEHSVTEQPKELKSI